MIDLIKQIISTRRSMGLPIQLLPRNFDAKEFVKYRDFLQEEFVSETEGAQLLPVPNNFITVADAMADGAVFMAHMVIIQGLSVIIDDVWNEILYSNSTKGGPNGEVFDQDGKLIKGQSYQRPNLDQFFSGSITLVIDGPKSDVLLGLYTLVCEAKGLSYMVEAKNGSSELSITGGDCALYAAFRGEVGRHLINGSACAVMAVTKNFVAHRQWVDGPFVRIINHHEITIGDTIMPLDSWREHKLPLSEL